MFGHIIIGIVVLPPHASTIERERKRRQKNMFDSLLSLFFFLELSFSLSQSSLPLLSISLPTISSLFLSLITLSLLYSLLFSLTHSLSYSRLSYSLSLTLTPTIFPTLFPLSLHSLHRILSSLALSPISLSFSYAHSYSVYLLFCLSYSLSLSILLSPTLSLSLLISLSLSYSVSHTLSPPLHYFSLPLLLLSALSLPLCVSVVGFCGGDTTIRTKPYIPFIHVIKTMKDYAVV